MVKVEVVENLNELEDYERLILNSKIGMFYHSWNFLRFLDHLLDAKPIVIKYYEKNRLVGILPMFLKFNRKYGNILNSLPFYGSHGGVVISSNYKDSYRIMINLLNYLKNEIIDVYDIIASTLITTPFETNTSIYKELLQPNFLDYRIGQIVRLPSKYDENLLLYSFESRCRRAIRKAIKNNVRVEIMKNWNQNIIEKLYKLHLEHMRQVNGLPKPSEFFNNLNKFFEINRDFQIYYAIHDEEIIGVLLLFYYKSFIEYYVPVTDAKNRSLNPMNLIVFRAMLNAIKNGFKLWNFGGTWKNQKGVYAFKKGFRAKDQLYSYFVNIYNDISELLTLTPNEIQKEYKWFYVLPFDRLGVKNYEET